MKKSVFCLGACGFIVIGVSMALAVNFQLIQHRYTSSPTSENLNATLRASNLALVVLAVGIIMLMTAWLAHRTGYSLRKGLQGWREQVRRLHRGEAEIYGHQPTFSESIDEIYTGLNT